MFKRILAGLLAISGAVLVVPAAPAAPALANDPAGTVVISSGHKVYSIALSPGRVTWVDNSTSADPVRKRAVTLSGGAVALGNPHQLGLSHYPSNSWTAEYARLLRPQASGVRTLWGEVTRDCLPQSICDSVGLRVHLSKGLGVTWTHQGNPLRMSGLQALFQLWHGEILRYDQHYGSLHSVSNIAYQGTRYRVASADVFGNDLVYALMFRDVPSGGTTKVVRDDSIRHKNVVTGKTDVLVPASSPQPGQHYQTNLFVWGDWIAWDRKYADGGRQVARNCGMRNFRTMAPVVKISPCPESLTSAGVVSHHGVTHQWMLRPYDGSPVPLPVPNTATQVTIDGDVLGWVEADGTAKLAPLPDPPAARPRALAPAISYGFVRPGRSSGGVDVTTSASLTSCQFELSQNDTVVTTLPCNPGLVSSGVASFRWDGKNELGQLLPSGSYRWKVVAANADGGLLRADGADQPITGGIAIYPPD